MSENKFEKVIEAWKVFAIKIQELFDSIFNGIINFCRKIIESKEEITEIKKIKFKLDFTRPIIKHQVLDRRPKNLIIKIM